MWTYRDLLYFLTLRDVKIRYKQTALGVVWAVLQPLLTMLIFTLFFGRVAKIPSDGIPYPLFAFAGLLPWTFFANAVTNCGSSLVSHAALTNKVYFPRLIMPAAGSNRASLPLWASAVWLARSLWLLHDTGTSRRPRAGGNGSRLGASISVVSENAST